MEKKPVKMEKNPVCVEKNPVKMENAFAWILKQAAFAEIEEIANF
jgi:hypothetical protein